MCEAIQEGLNEKALSNDKTEDEETLEDEVSIKEDEEEDKGPRTGRRRRMGESDGDEVKDEKKRRPASRRPIQKK